MEEYQSNGGRLGWLIDRANKQVYIYRADGSVDIKEGKTVKLSGEDVLDGLVIDAGF